MLCYRCEYRAQFLEKDHAPRLECKGTSAVIGCYMYKPVAPLVLKPREGDNRPKFGEIGSMLSGRAEGVRKSEPIIQIVELGNDKYTFNLINKLDG